jgi:hypothetical protein
MEADESLDRRIDGWEARSQERRRVSELQPLGMVPFLSGACASLGRNFGF